MIRKVKSRLRQTKVTTKAINSIITRVDVGTSKVSEYCYDSETDVHMEIASGEGKLCKSSIYLEA